MNSSPPVLCALPAFVLLTAACSSAPPDEQTSHEDPQSSTLGFYQEWRPPSERAVPTTAKPIEPCRQRAPLRQAFFGDLHTHTAFSFDALLRGGFQTPDDAYRFARGEAIGLSPLDDSGQPTRTAQLARPLDFAAVTDHAEWLGEVGICTDPASDVYDSPECRGMRPRGTGDERSAWRSELVQGRGPTVCGEDGSLCRQRLSTAWEQTRRAAEDHQDRTADCSFTTFQAWEYSRSPGRSKVHRNVILRNHIAPELPISWIDAPEPEDLWSKLKRRCNDTGSGCEALTIPHNPNISNGQMFTLQWKDLSFEEQRRRAALRSELEPLVEMMQAKGESECRRSMWGVVPGEDEFCDFEKVRYIEGDRPPDCENGTGTGGLDGRGCQSRLDFARYALIEGLAQEARLGINPMQFGMIGSTDGHNGTPGDTDEFDYQGQNADVDASLETRLTTPAYAPHKLRNPGGLIGVWADENSRDAIWGAMKRREAFGTSGVRIKPRFFGGWDLPEELCSSQAMVATAYEFGVPMGSVLPTSTSPPASTRPGPSFLVTALADPGTREHPGGALQRLQVIKGWVDDDGLFNEQIIDVAGGDNGANVSRETCEPTSGGAKSLCAVWRDPNFDPDRGAVYYARIIENPSCRWNAHQCADLAESDRPAACDDPDLPWSIQERAWTSPIWYQPTGDRD